MGDDESNDENTENRSFEGEISIIVKINWEDGHEARWNKIQKLKKEEAKAQEEEEPESD